MQRRAVNELQTACGHSTRAAATVADGLVVVWLAVGFEEWDYSTASDVQRGKRVTLPGLLIFVGQGGNAAERESFRPLPRLLQQLSLQ